MIFFISINFKLNIDFVKVVRAKVQDAETQSKVLVSAYLRFGNEREGNLHKYRQTHKATAGRGRHFPAGACAKVWL